MLVSGATGAAREDAGMAVSKVIAGALDAAAMVTVRAAETGEWALFLAELAALPWDDSKGAQGEPGSLQAAMSVAMRLYSPEPREMSADDIEELFADWRLARTRADAAAARKQHLASTVETRMWRGNKWGKTERVSREEAARPWKPGTVIVAEDARVTAVGSFDRSTGPSYEVASTAIGTEHPAGTVVGKRMVGGAVQYLIKPRSKAAEARYQRGLRMAEIETQLRVNAEYMSAEQIAALRTELEGAGQ